MVSTSDRDWKRRRHRTDARGRGRRSPSPRRRSTSARRRPQSPRRRSSSSNRRKSSREDKRANVSQTLAFTDTKVAECLQADKQKLHADLKYKFSKVILNLKEENQKMELSGPPADVKGAFMFLFHQLQERFQSRYPQIRDVAFEISGPPATGRPTPEPSPDRKKKCHDHKEGRSANSSLSREDSNNKVVVASMSLEIEEWKKKFQNLQNSAKSKCQELQTELNKCKADGKEDLAAKDQRIMDIEKEKDNLMKSLEEKTAQVGQAMEQVSDLYNKYQESQAKVQELEKGSVNVLKAEPDTDPVIKKEVGAEQQEMVRTRKELTETKKKLRQLEVNRVRNNEKHFYFINIVSGKVHS